MREWSVRAEISAPGMTFTEGHADEVMDALAANAPAVSYDPKAMSIRFCVEADSVGRASRTGLDLLRSALKAVGIRIPPATIVAYEIEGLEDLDRRVGKLNLPDLVGVDEVAKMLDVSKQRASELARRANFPKPIARLASGPVWKKASIARHARTWDRRPGRKKALATSK